MRLDALRAENPAQYQKVMGIISLAGDVSCEILPQMLRVRFDAKNVQCTGALILTSYPAKRRVSFTLEDTDFAGNVVLTGKPGTLVPATDKQATRVTRP